MAGLVLLQQLTDLVERPCTASSSRCQSAAGCSARWRRCTSAARFRKRACYYERQKHDGTLPIIGVNTFLSRETAEAQRSEVTLIRSSDEEKDAQVAGVRGFQARHAARGPAALRELQQVATSGGNVFAELIKTVRWCSLGQISHALYDVGGRYRRSV